MRGDGGVKDRPKVVLAVMGLRGGFLLFESGWGRQAGRQDRVARAPHPFLTAILAPSGCEKTGHPGPDPLRGQTSSVARLIPEDMCGRSGQFRPLLGSNWLTLGSEFGFGSTRLGLGSINPWVGFSATGSTKLGRDRPTLFWVRPGSIRPELRRLRPLLGWDRPTSGSTKLGWPRPGIAWSWPTSGLDLPRFGRIRTRVRPGSIKLRPGSTPCARCY